MINFSSPGILAHAQVRSGRERRPRHLGPSCFTLKEMATMTALEGFLSLDGHTAVTLTMRTQARGQVEYLVFEMLVTRSWSRCADFLDFDVSVYTLPMEHS